MLKGDLQKRGVGENSLRHDGDVVVKHWRNITQNSTFTSIACISFQIWRRIRTV